MSASIKRLMAQNIPSSSKSFLLVAPLPSLPFTGPYLVLVSNRRLTGSLGGHNIWQITGVEFVPVARGLHHRSSSQVDTRARLSVSERRAERCACLASCSSVVCIVCQVRSEAMYLNMAKAFFALPHFYFSYTMDLTVSLHAQSRGISESVFCWSRYLQLPFQQLPEFSSYRLPIMHGFVSINSALNVNGHVFDFILVSRRSTRRAGLLVVSLLILTPATFLFLRPCILWHAYVPRDY